jgi:hypothetical protein
MQHVVDWDAVDSGYGKGEDIRVDRLDDARVGSSATATAKVTDPKLLATDIESQRTSGPPVSQYRASRVAPSCITIVSISARNDSVSTTHSSSLNVSGTSSTAAPGRSANGAGDAGTTAAEKHASSRSNCANCFGDREELYHDAQPQPILLMDERETSKPNGPRAGSLSLSSWLDIVIGKRT